MISLNLLPFRRKELFFWRKRTKKIILNGIKMIVLLVFFIIPLYAINFYLTKEIGILNAQIEAYEKTESVRQLNLMEKSFKDINKFLIKIDKISEGQVYWSSIFKKISAIIPFNVQIFSLQIDPSGIFTITGNAKTREDVLELGKRLKSSADFSDIQAPLDNLIKSEDINFRFSGNIILDNFKKKKI